LTIEVSQTEDGAQVLKAVVLVLDEESLNEPVGLRETT